MILSLNLVKKHVRSDDFSEDDDYLCSLTEAAEQFVIRDTNRTFDELVSMSEDGDFPKTLQQAVLMLVGHWYNQREAVAGVTMTEVPYTIQALIKPYVKLV